MKFLILAGGVGSRLWPLSTNEKPKQFHSFIGDKTLLQLAYDRLGFASPHDIFIATNSDYTNLVLEQLPLVESDHVISEPSRRDTGPSISFAMKFLADRFGPNETVSIIYADHLILKTDEFKTKLEYAHALVHENNKFVIIEVKAKTPNTNFGYVKIGDLVKEEDGNEVFELDHFTEKPNYETAKKFVESFKYLWNTGIYIFKTGHFLEKLKEFAPEIYGPLLKIEDFANCQNIYNTFPKISLDYALLEKINPKDVWIIPAELGWSDIGTWNALHQELTTHSSENLSDGNVSLLDCNGNLVINKENQKKIVVINANNLVVINTPDQLLICNKDEDLKIKEYLQNQN